MNYELVAINDLIEGKLVNYGAELAKVEAVNDKGLTIDCIAVDKAAGAQSYKAIPVVKNPYINAPIQKGDFVLLLKTAYLLGQFMAAGSQTSSFKAYSFFALPICNTMSFKFEANDTIVTNSDGSTTIDISKDKGFELTAKKDAKVECQNFEMKASQSLAIDAGSQPFEIKNGSGSLGDALSALIDLVDELKGSAVVAGQASLTWLPNYDTKKVEVQAKIQQITK